MYMKQMRKIMMILAVTAVIATGLNAQVVRNDVIKAYNEGAGAMQTDIPAAIKAFENVIVLADQVGTDAADLREKAVKVIPSLYVKVANAALTEKKPVAEVIKLARTASAVAEKFGNTTGKDNAGKIMLQAYNSMAADYFSKNDFDNALLAFDSLLTIKPDYMSAIYNKALIYIKKDDAGSFEKTIDLYLENLKKGNDEEKIKKASTMALEYFRAAGSKANAAEKLDDAIALLSRAAKYGDDKDLFYYFADVYNKQKNFDSGAEYAQKGLSLETGDAIARAKFYYQLAVAQVGKGQNAEACESFKNALYGDFAEAAKAQRTNLKCE